MQLQQNNTATFSATFIFLAGISGAGLLIPRELGFTLLFGYFSAFFGYFWLVNSQMPVKAFFTIGVLARLLLLLKMPSLSDDIFRFIWDGYLIQYGMNPYTQLPSELLNNNIPGITTALYNRLNSQPYHSVYPPLNQAFFWLSTLPTDNMLAQTNILRTGLLLSDIGSFWLLRKILISLGKNPHFALWYFLNPLVILESVGNVHFEGVVVFFLLLGIFTFVTNRTLLSGIGFGLAVATKLLPLIYLPALFFHSPRGKGLKISLITGCITGLTFIPFFASGTMDGLQSSLELYFQKFEFNASFYFIFRAIGFWIKGYNIIGILGPWLSFFTFVGILVLSVVGTGRKWPLPQAMLFALTWYLLLATTVHPWYILPLIALGLLSGYYYPVVWSAVIFVTYVGYTNTGYELNPVWIVFEYLVVLVTLSVELYKKNERHLL